MLVQEIQSSALATILPASLVIFLFVVFFRRNKKPLKLISNQEVEEKLLAFEPEPLVSSNVDDNEDLKTPMPDESFPGCLNLAKVNYLNFLNNEYLRKEAEDCIKFYGVGPCGPRGFYGTIDVHLTLESRIANFMGMEETVLYSYGFSTISSAVGAYCKKSDIVFCDEEISFAARQGLVAARSTVEYFKHNDMDDLEAKLKIYSKKEEQKKKIYRKFLIVEGIYRSTGTICKLPQLMELREKYKLRIFIDESTSFGILGKTGRGVTEHFNVDRSNVDMIMGSLESSLSSIGGFCVGASVVIEHQRLSGLGYCFSASLPPFLSQITISAIDLFEKDPSVFSKLQSLSTFVDNELRKLDDYVVISDRCSPLKVITTKDEQAETVKKIHDYCSQKHIYMVDTDNRLSFNLNITLEKDDVLRVVEVLREAHASL